MFEFFLSYGWLVMAVAALFWLLVAKPNSPTIFGPDMVIVVGILAFIWGIWIAIYSTDVLPQVITGWGNNPSTVIATIDTSRLASFQDSYDIAVVAGATDPGTDRYNDTRVTISKLFSIHCPEPITIQAPRSPIMNTAIAELQSTNPTTPFGMWYEAILLPIGTDMTIVHSLADVPKYNGKILRKEYFK